MAGTVKLLLDTAVPLWSITLVLPIHLHSVGSRGSALTVVPFNQGSKQDVEAPIDYIYATLGMDLRRRPRERL